MPTVEELQAEIAVLDERRRVVQSLLEAMKAYERVSALGVHKVNGAATKPATKPRPASAMSDTASVAAELMETTQRPVSTASVVEEMRRRGMTVPLLNTNNTIAARLSNNPRFRGQRGQGYWFADRPWPGDEFEDLLITSPPASGEDI